MKEKKGIADIEAGYDSELDEGTVVESESLCCGAKHDDTMKTVPELVVKETVAKRGIERLIADEVSPEEDLSAMLAEILAPVYEYSHKQGHTEEEIGEFVDTEVAKYRAERRAPQTSKS